MRYKIKKIKKDSLRHLHCYSVESMYDDATIYLADNHRFAIVRHGEAEVCYLMEAYEMVNRLIEPFREEAMEVLEDVVDLIRDDVIVGERGEINA